MTDVQGPTTPGRVPDERFLDYLSSAADMVGGRRFREAEVEVLRALSITPSDLRALKLLTLVRFKLGRLDEARALCRELATTLPRDPGIRLKLGLIALKLERIDESIHELELAARLAPEDLRAWNYLGYAYTRRGERERAAAAFRRAGQEALAVETEREGSGRWEQAVLSPAPAASEGSGPRASASGSGSGRVVAPVGATPSAPYEPAFDQSLQLQSMPSDPRVDPDRPLTGPRMGSGGLPVAPLVGYAVSRLAPPTEQASWVGAAARLSIAEGAFVRADAVVACSGVAVRWEDAFQRERGRPTHEPLGRDGAAFSRVSGRGDLFVGAPYGRLVPLLLEDDVLYLREDCVAAFEGSVAWEHGHVPRAPVAMLQFRGKGLVMMCVRGEPGAIKVTPERPAHVTARFLLGWIGRVVARGADVGAAGTVAKSAPITCEGEGVVLFDVEREARS
ncbi:MAG TPA: tetratricopeptide repeat protein [Polyangia bacterium]|nr:tetratricopeptide repeat protein [Polyangia bacterium]